MPPLNFGLQDVDSLKLYGMEFSPPCAKIRALLKYHDIPFENVEGKHPTSQYQKMPVMEINGRQVNDSYAISEAIWSLVRKKPHTEEELEWENMIANEFMPAFEVELAFEANDICNITGFVGAWQRALVSLISPILGAALEAVFGIRYPEMKLPSSQYGVKFREALGKKKFFHGDSPGPVDLSFYGTYCAFSDRGCRTPSKILQAACLDEWHQRMVEAVPRVGKIPKFLIEGVWRGGG